MPVSRHTGHRQDTINVHNQLFSYVLAQLPDIHSTAGHRQGTLIAYKPVSELIASPVSRPTQHRQGTGRIQSTYITSYSVMC